jgi:hypothetical protein
LAVEEVVDAHIRALEKIIDVHSRHLDDYDIDVDAIADYWKEVARQMAQIADDAVRYGVVFGVRNDD